LPTIGFHPLSFGMPGGPIHPFPIGCPVCPRRAFTRAVWLTLRRAGIFPSGGQKKEVIFCFRPVRPIDPFGSQRPVRRPDTQLAKGIGVCMALRKIREEAVFYHQMHILKRRHASCRRQRCCYF
jgi:hypothetical protein